MYIRVKTTSRLLMTCNTGFIHKMVQYVHLYTDWPSNTIFGTVDQGENSDFSGQMI